MSWNRELTLDEALSDPMIRAVMAADGVDPRRFETSMRAAARRLAAAPRRPTSPAALAARARCGTPAVAPCAW